MKCIRCGTDSKYKDRTGRSCPHCMGQFAFEPQDGDPLTDPAFKSAIDNVSSEGTMRWGVEHLYYEVCRKRRSRMYLPVVGAVVLLGIAVFLLSCGLLEKMPLFVIAALVPGGIAAVSLTRRSLMRYAVVDMATFNRMWERWQAVHGKPEGVIQRRQPPASPPQTESDLADYSFDRAIICDRARTVDLLLANNFHFENNCAVLSIEGYPKGPFQTVRAMLKRNPNIHVFALHDATPAGCLLAQRLANDADWFGGKTKVVDVGLRPAQAKPFLGLLLPNSSGPVEPQEGLMPEEAAWLSSHALELAAIRPEQVLKRMFRAINRKTDQEDGGGNGNGSGGGVSYDGASFGADAGDSDGGADSFG
jgi:hypothetical protein